MKIELKIAIRYIFSKHSFNFITIINLLSLIGISIGVAALIVVLSIFNAFQSLAIKQIVGFDPHIKIEIKNSINDSNKLVAYLKSKAIVQSFALTSEGKAVCFKDNKVRVINLLSVSQTDTKFFDNLKDFFILGNNNLSIIRKDGLPKILIGAGLADAMKVLNGDTLTFINPSDIEQTLLTLSMPNLSQAIIEGVYQSNIKDYDYSYAFSTFTLSNRIFGDKFANSLMYEIRLKDLKFLESFTNELKKSFPDAKISSWKDLNKAYYNVMKFEKMATSFILGIIILVAIFNVFASLTMTIIEKKKDISIMRTIGATQRFIVRLYLYEGLFVGFIGSIFGGLLGLFLCWGQINYKWFKIDGTKYIMDSIPILINYTDVIATVLLSFLLTTLATIYPAKKASNINIIEMLREE
jgi:lipoprotein-releasing system permease protein